MPEFMKVVYWFCSCSILYSTLYSSKLVVWQKKAIAFKLSLTHYMARILWTPDRHTHMWANKMSLYDAALQFPLSETREAKNVPA